MNNERSDIPSTETRNPASADIDQLSSLELVDLMHGEDLHAVRAVEAAREQIAAAIDVTTNRLRNGGRLVYLGAGTSGRLGVLDASECPPTFGVAPDLVCGLIAGGDSSLRSAQEGAEDRTDLAREDLQQMKLSSRDVLVGISASGRTPYVIGGVQTARGLGAATIGISCNEQSPLHELVEISIRLLVGPEVIAGSTRLKAGTATKMVLNTLSTAVMVATGRTLGNVMADLRAGSEKLKARSLGIVMQETGADRATAEGLLHRASGEVRLALEFARSPKPETDS